MPKGLTGAFPSPRHKLAAAQPFRPTLTAIPATWGVVAPLYRMWGNDRYGVCVTSEEAANIANFCAASGIPGHVLTDDEVITWARRNGFLNGAYLEEVMDKLQVAARDGLPGGLAKHFVGPYRAVDWHDRPALCAAIYESRAQVNIGIASSGLNNQPGDDNGWIVLSASKSRSIDHCVGLCGYGTLAEMCAHMRRAGARRGRRWPVLLPAVHVGHGGYRVRRGPVGDVRRGVGSAAVEHRGPGLPAVARARPWP